MNQGLAAALAADIVAERFEVFLNFWSRSIALRSGAHGDRRKRRPIVDRIHRFKRLVPGIQPWPCALLVSGLRLLRPHVIERGAGILAELAVPGVRGG